MSHSLTMKVWKMIPQPAPTTVTAARTSTHLSVAPLSPVTMPVSMARPTIQGPRVCGTIHMRAAARPHQKTLPCCRTIQSRKARGERVSGSSAVRST
jgi:hypothetical protein